MTREQAITTLALHLMQCGMLMPIEWIDKNGEGSDTMLAFNMAMEALREQAERGKGCDYCGLIYKLDGASYGTDSVIIENRFCPMCGKRLEVEHGN